MSSVNTNTEVSMKPFQDYYGAKDWLKATQWLDTNKSQLDEGLYYFNMGTLAIKQDQLPLARYYFEQANLKNFNDPWVNKNITSLKQDMGVQLIETQSFYEQMSAKLFSYITPDHLLAFTFTVILALVVYWWKNKISKSFYTLTATLVLTIAIGGYALTKADASFSGSKLNQAIVIEPMNIYEGPSTIFEELGKLPAGLKITWDENNHGWAKIVSPLNFRGWIQFDEKSLKELK